MPTKTPSPALIELRQDFRHHLEQFYASLNLAPPYDSLEKAVRHLSKKCERKTREDMAKLFKIPNLKWKFYDEIFVESGLSQKHRGIIRGLLESKEPPSLPPQYRNFVKAFRPKKEEPFEIPQEMQCSPSSSVFKKC